MAEEVKFYRETEFKDTEIGKIPKEWEVVKLTDIAEDIYYGITAKAVENKTGLKMLRTTDIKDYTVDWGSLPFCEVTEKRGDIQRFLLKEGDLIIARAGSTGVSVLVEKDFDDVIFGSYLIKVRLTKKVHPKFMHYFCQSRLYWDHIASSQAGSTLKNISLPVLKSLNIPLSSSIEEQQKIAQILSIVDEAIQKTDDIIAKTERLKKGLIQELLTKGIGHNDYVETEIGKFPKDWEVKKLKEIAEQMYYGLSVSGVETPTQYKLITTTSINKETFKLDEGKIPFCNLIINEDKQTKKFTKYFVKKGDILISRSGTTGVAILIDKDYNNMLFGSYLIKIKLNSLIDPKFFWYFSQSPFYWQQVSSRGATIKNINLQILKNLQVPLPTLEEQRKISEILLAVDEKLENLRREKTKLERTKQWFMEELLTGRIRVRIA